MITPRTAEPSAPHPRSLSPRRPIGRTATALAAGLLLVSMTGTAQAVTKVTVTNPNGLTAVGPTNSDHGFPAFYQDSNNVRIEPCLDGDNPLCGFLPGDIPDPDAPVSFPDNFPEELFYSLIDSTLTLPNGGKVALTLGLEASFANGAPIQGDQVTFARTRVTVVGGPANTTLTFKHPFGELTIDTDATGKGRLVQDITPAVGNFATPLKSNFGPFLKWDPAVAPAAPAGFLGDPAQAHKVVGSPLGYNQFSTVVNGVTVSTDQFGVSGRIATNTGVVGDRAIVNRSFVDVFATSAGDQLQVDGVAGSYATTPLTNEPGTSRHYARLALTGPAPTSVVVRNLADKPMSSATISIADTTITAADYDGTNLTVAAESASFPVVLTGIGTLIDNRPHAFPVAAPPSSVTARSTAGSTVSAPVVVTDGAATSPGLPPVPAAPAGPPVNDNTPDNTPSATPVATVVTPTATVPGAQVVLDGSTSARAVSYAWTQVSGPTATLSGATTAKPTVTLPYFTAGTQTAPSARWATVSFQLVVTDGTGTASAPTVVEVPVKTDTLTIAAGARHKVGTELRVDGTSLIDGTAGARTPATSITLWNTTGATPVKLGTATVDTLGAWSLRLRPGPSAQVTSVLVQSSRGATGTTAVLR